MTEKTKHESKIPEETREHFRKAHDELHKSVETLLPAGFMEHRREARKEMLMAMRSLFDAAIERLDKKA